MIGLCAILILVFQIYFLKMDRTFQYQLPKSSYEMNLDEIHLQFAQMLRLYTLLTRS